MSCDLSIVLHVTYEGSAFAALFLDMRNAISSHFLTACTVQVSVRVFATKRTRKRTRLEGHNLYVTSVCNRYMGSVDFCIAPSPRRNILNEK